MRRFSVHLGSIVTMTTLLAVIPSNTHGHGGGGGGGHGGGGHGGYGGYGGYHGGYGGYHGGYGGYHGGYYGGYHGGYYPYHGFGPYRPYGYGLYAPYGFGFGAGLGLGAMAGFGLGYGLYQPYYGYGGTTVISPTVVVAPPAGSPPLDGTAPTQTPPPPDNAAHLQLIVPENAEVVFEGGKTTQTGPTREFVSPPLPAGKAFNYTIIVRYTDANGKPIDDRRVIQVHANDWYRIDFTRPAPPEPMPAP